jgi:hypothetical protein
MILKIYIIASIAGLLFPIFDSLAIKYSKDYTANENRSKNHFIHDYREFPVKYKLIAAFFPVFHLVWCLVLVQMGVFFIICWWFNRKIQFIKWLAEFPIKENRWFIFRTKLVKKVFPSYLELYYTAFEASHAQEIADSMVNLIVKLIRLSNEKIPKEEKTESKCVVKK